MKKFPIIKKCPLFSGIEESDLIALLSCISGRRQTYKKGGCIVRVGERVANIGIVLSGRVLLQKVDFWGNRTILSEIESPDLFAEAFSCVGESKLSFTVMATESTEVMFLDYGRIVTSCTSACGFHTRLIQNMLRIVARKNIELVEKIEHITKRTTREKLLSFLSEQARLVRSNVFVIPFDRQELADYLAVERSAMSAELSKMQDEGLVNYRKNHFELFSQ